MGPGEPTTCGGGSLQSLLVGAVCEEGAGFASRIGTGFPGVALAARAYPWLPSLIPPGSREETRCFMRSNGRLRSTAHGVCGPLC
jgi:hypothetical protein